MTTKFVAAAAAAVLSACSIQASWAAQTIVPYGPREPEEERKAFTVPPGFEVQLVASEPDIHKPINLAFDDRGRLWVTDTVEYPFPAAADATTPDSVKILDDFDQNGRARKITTFANNLNIPIGVLPQGDNAALVYSIPYIWKMTDTSGRGVADKREIFLGTYQHVDTHGMTGSFTEGFDGWIHAVHGYRNTSTVRASDGSQITMNSGNTYRFKRDGSHIEYVTHGQVNPFGLCYDPLGNLYSSDCETMPVALDLRGAYYPSFGKPDDGLGFAPDIIDHFYGSTAIAGLCDYVADQFPEQYRNRMFVGNVMTNKINDAKLTPRGSGVHGDDVPDFLVSSDAWFRPTNIKLGPDGAMYVADFYNRIIGHYEVDLHHPGRDKQRGRIWRIVYKGKDASPAPAKKFDLTKASVQDMVDDLASPNMTIRMLAMNRLADIVGQPAVVPLKKVMAESSNIWQKIHGMWVLYRLGALDAGELKSAATDSDARLREHAMRVLGEKPQWDSGENELVLNGTRDPDPLVRRTAAAALGEHPSVEHVRPLLDLAERPDGDVFIEHVVRIALRDQMLVPGVCPTLQTMQLSDRDESLLAASAIGAPTSESASFLLNHVTHESAAGEQIAKQLKMIARLVPAQQVEELAKFVQTKFADDVELQLALFNAVQEGLAERGTTTGEAMRSWGTSLATQLLQEGAGNKDSWTFVPLPGKSEEENPWGVQTRKSIDGDASSAFLSSNVHGEQLTGTIRSHEFVVPSKLSFYLAGHNGPPPQKHKIKNFVMIRDARTGQVLAKVNPPRNDVARLVTLDLSKYAGRHAVVEATDGDDQKMYAWMALGRFDPPVVRVPVGGSMLENAVKIVQSLRLTPLAAKVQDLLTDGTQEPGTRAAAAKALGALDAPDHVQALSTVVRDPKAPDQVRQSAAGVLATIDVPAASDAMVQAMQTAPQKLQLALAQSLASGRGGAEALLVAIEQGKASARLLQDSNVRERVGAVQPRDYEQRIEKLTKGLPAADAQIQALIDQRAAAFNAAAASSKRGRLVFEKNCMICHSVANQGAHVGPPLDGIGIRGVPRLCEDILDPSRNVAADFRQSTFVLNDGSVVAGIPRRTEGQTIVVADSTGKEVSIDKSKITRQAESKLSLMPSNFGEIIPTGDFNDLLSYLLSVRQ